MSSNNSSKNVSIPLYTQVTQKQIVLQFQAEAAGYFYLLQSQPVSFSPLCQADELANCRSTGGTLLNTHAQATKLKEITTLNSSPATPHVNYTEVTPTIKADKYL